MANTPPKNLSLRAKKLWKTVDDEWLLDKNALIILERVCESFDRYLQAKDLLDAEGIIIKSSTGLPKKHPAVEVERIARVGFLQAWRMLNLDVEPPGEVGRPGGSKKH